MVKVPVSLYIGAGMASGEAVCAAATPAPTPEAPTPTVVSAAALDPAALRKFLREYAMFKPSLHLGDARCP